MSRTKLMLLKLPRLFAFASILAGSTMTLAEQPLIEPEARGILQKSMLFLSNQQQFTIQTESSDELVLDSGQKIQLDNSVDVSVQRPNRLYAKRQGELLQQEFFYDGKSLTLYDKPGGYYASIAAPHDLDQMLDFARDSLNIEAPAGDFVYSNAYDLLMEGVESGFVVGRPVYIDGIECDHVAFSKPGTDFQIWIERGARPLPRRIVITSRDILSAPQSTVNIRNWNLAPKFSKQEFSFPESAKATQIEFSVLDQAD